MIKGNNMGLTLDELKLIENVMRTPDEYLDDNYMKALELVEREIKLKETDFITMTDVNGNMMDDGN